MAFVLFSSKKNDKKYSLIKESVPIIQLYIRYAGIQWPMFAAAIILAYIHIKIGPIYAIGTLITVTTITFLYAKKNKDKVKAYIENIEKRKKNAIDITNKEYEKLHENTTNQEKEIIATNDSITEVIITTSPEKNPKKEDTYISPQNPATSIPYSHYNTTKINIKYEEINKKKDQDKNTKTTKDNNNP